MEQEAQIVMLKKVSRQLRLLNILMVVFGLTILAGFIVAGIVFAKVATYANNTLHSVNNLQSDIKSQTGGLNVENLCKNADLQKYVDTTTLCQ